MSLIIMYLSGREEVVRAREPWFTKVGESLVKRKEEAYVKMRREGSVRALQSYRLSRKDLKRELRKVRRGHHRIIES